MSDLAQEIKEQALKELAEEDRQRLVDLEKERILADRAKPKYLFPWRIRIVNLNKE